MHTNHSFICFFNSFNLFLLLTLLTMVQSLSLSLPFSFYFFKYLTIFFSLFVCILFERVFLYLPFNEGTWQVLIPVTLGFDSCLSNPCIYNKINEFEGNLITTDLNLQFHFLQIRKFIKIFYFLSVILTLISFFLNLFYFKSSSMKCSRYIYPLSVCCLIVCSCLYFLSMYCYLNGGFFQEGSILLLFSTTLGMSACSLYFTELPPISSDHSYLPIP